METSLDLKLSLVTRKEFSVVLTTLFDRNGMKMKSLVAPPGTETYVKSSNEIETKWMERACVR